ncbi:MAG TPA: hypothetical protein VMF52_16875 [Steroidobacteraceae bacterium]|nr:hypothetical protein [Steroidobacteraceae bacterium]
MSAVFTTAGRKLVLFLGTSFLAVSAGFAQETPPASAASGPVEVVNIATANYRGPTAQADGDEPPQMTTSNAVTAQVTIAPPTLTIYNDPGFTNAPRVVDTGDDLWVRVNAPGCQHDLGVREWFTIKIRSLTSGDEEEYVVKENAPDSGVFDVTEPINTGRVDGPVVPLNKLLELWGRDELDAEMENCGGVAVDTVLVDPDGIVFDSQTNATIPGATVHLVDVTGAGNGGHPGGDAQVFDFDGVTELAPSIVTGADGRFQFPFVPESEYQLIVDPPAGYRGPSIVPADQQPAGRMIKPGSFSVPFSVNAQTGAVTLDFPLDPIPAGLVVEKRATRPTAEIGESVGYEVKMRNLSGFAIRNLTLHDDLPPGFSYLPGSARLGDAAVADPAGGQGPALDFTIASLPGSGESTLSYRVVIGPGALEGDGTNRAKLSATLPAPQSSNVASAKVDVQAGVFDDRAFVLGRVFADCNRNGRVDAGEPGLPRVRLYMEDGSWVITDGEGKYSFYGVLPRTHVLKVDATTLPDGVKLAAISHRNAGRGDSRFLDVQRGELHRADFATDGCGPALVQTLETLRKAAGGARELDGVKNALRREENPLGDTRALPATGVVGEAAPLPATSLPRLAAIGMDAIAANVGRTDLRTLMPKLDAWLGFVDLYDGAEVGTTELTVRVKGQTSAVIRLSVNDVEVGGEHIGLKLEDPTRLVQAVEYVGVPLGPGANRLSLAQKDNAGHFREVVAVTVTAPGALAQLKIATPAEGIPADGDHSAQVRVSVVDVAGVKVTSRTAVTLEAQGGEWSAIDLDPVEPGTQVFIEGGEGSFGLRSRTPGTAKVRATAGAFSTEANVSFVSALRPLIGVGVLEGTFNLDHLDGSALTRARSNDGFERELRSFGREDGTNGGARAALFLKGKIKGDYLLTLGYDSDKDTKERLFRDIQPDQFYPVYGDSSTKGYDAQTTGRLYVRVERNKSSFTGGDLTTASLSRARMMGAYNRSLTGVKEHFENDAATVEVFASRDTARQVVDEIPANGTSGPYPLSNANLLENSERVEIITRDRDQPAVILAVAVKQRFVDYDLEPLTGRLLFRAPIPSVTADLDPISVRVTYEVEQGGEEFWTTGMDSQLRLGKRAELGASFVDDRNPQDPRRISGVNATVRFGTATTLVAEGARTESLVSDGDTGARVELRHEGRKLTLRAFGSRTGENFDNPSGGFTKNREEAGAKAAISVSERARLVAELLSSGDATTGVKREGGLVGLERNFADNWKAELGVRHVRASGDTTPDDATTSVRARVTAPLPFARDASLYGEYEQDLADADARVAAVGGEYRLAPRSRLYARHEIISSLTGPYSLDAAEKHNTTVFGIDSTYWQDDSVFSEYRIGDSLNGREAQAAIGLRNAWQVAEGVRISTSAERVDMVGGDRAEDSTAVTGGVEFTRSPLWKSSARLELRDATSSDSALLTIGAARKLNAEWTLLTRALFAVTDNATGEDRRQDRLQAGAAYRGDDNRVNALMRYELKREDGVEAGMDRTAHIVSLHADLQQTTRLKLDGTLAAKWVAERFEATRHDAATLVAGRVTYDLAKRWDIGMNIRGLFDKDFSGVQGGVGAEVGFLVTQNLWISTGYNVLGFRDADLAGDEYTQRGAYLRLRFKFDETVLP